MGGVGPPRPDPGGCVLESQLELAGPGTDDYPGRPAGLVSVDRLWRVDGVGCPP